MNAMSQCTTTSIDVDASIIATTSVNREETVLPASGASKRGQSVDDLAITRRPTWKDNLREKREKLKQRSLTLDYFYG